MGVAPRFRATTSMASRRLPELFREIKLLRKHYPDGATTLKAGTLRWTGELQPSEISNPYLVGLRYAPPNHPHVIVRRPGVGCRCRRPPTPQLPRWQPLSLQTRPVGTWRSTRYPRSCHGRVSGCSTTSSGAQPGNGVGVAATTPVRSTGQPSGPRTTLGVGAKLAPVVESLRADDRLPAITRRARRPTRPALEGPAGYVGNIAVPAAEVQRHRAQAVGVAAVGVQGQGLSGQELFNSPPRGRHPIRKKNNLSHPRTSLSRDNRQGSPSTDGNRSPSVIRVSPSAVTRDTPANISPNRGGTRAGRPTTSATTLSAASDRPQSGRRIRSDGPS